MSPTDKDYELVGRWLDGEDVELTGPQRGLAGEIAADAAAVSAAIAAPPPAGMLHRVSARLRRHRPARGIVRGPLRWASVAAAAAVVVAAALLCTVRPRVAAVPPAEYVRQFLYTPAGELDPRLYQLGEELTAYQVELALREYAAIEDVVDEIELELDGSAVTSPGDWGALEGSL